MATPIYKGTGQPAAAGGWLSGLASWFGSPAPSYLGTGQAAQGSTGFLGGATPAYKPAPTTDESAIAPSAASGDYREPERITVLIPRDPRELFEPRQ
jgi:hypothetical protein